jgi:hypothetical protein
VGVAAVLLLSITVPPSAGSTLCTSSLHDHRCETECDYRPAPGSFVPVHTRAPAVQYPFFFIKKKMDFQYF